MCRSVHVRLSEAERRTAARMWGVMVPVYACIGLVLLTTLVLNAGSRDGAMVADATHAAPMRTAPMR